MAITMRTKTKREAEIEYREKRKKELAAEALRRNENDSEKALDDLTNPETNSSTQQHLESRKLKGKRQKMDASVETLVNMGYERSIAVEAVQAGGTMEEILDWLLISQYAATQPGEIPTVDANNNSQSDAPMLDSQNGQVGCSSTSSKAPERDTEMEDELAEELAQGDALSDHDLEAIKAGEAIREYFALLASDPLFE